MAFFLWTSPCSGKYFCASTFLNFIGEIHIKRTCTMAFFLWTSPFGSGTYSSASRSNSVAYASQRPTRLTAPADN